MPRAGNSTWRPPERTRSHARLQPLRSSDLLLLRHAHRLGSWNPLGDAPHSLRARKKYRRRHAPKTLRRLRAAFRARQISSLSRSPRVGGPPVRHGTPIHSHRRRSTLPARLTRHLAALARHRPRTKLEVDFDEVITAQQAQAYKPALKLFELALSRIHSPAHRVLHVGQSIYHDVVPAQALGLATVWVNRPSARSGVGAVKAAEATPDLTVTSLAELAAAAFA